MVYIRVHTWGLFYHCNSMGFWQMYNGMYLPLQYHREYLHHPQNPLCFAYSSPLPLIPLATANLFTKRGISIFHSIDEEMKFHDIKYLIQYHKSNVLWNQILKNNTDSWVRNFLWQAVLKHHPLAPLGNLVKVEILKLHPNWLSKPEIGSKNMPWGSQAGWLYARDSRCWGHTRLIPETA